MGLETAARRPARMSLANLSTGDMVEAQFNPAGLEETLEVNWTRQVVPGLSHQPLQFVHTGNDKLAVELLFEALDVVSLDELLRARRFLQSLCYPRRGAQDVIGGAPPRVLFVWPTIASLTTVITSLVLKYERFNLAGTPTRFSAKVTLEEIRDIRLFSDDVLRSGTLRSSAGVGSR